ncbi:hypothetical protein ACFQRB_17095 [Halobaculum litoreum]|uniref:DNA helicase n=1 Tax=Halobaculum litoreum TaxID=3031998 RepID=A0ABD5XRF0_9EURY
MSDSPTPETVTASTREAEARRVVEVVADHVDEGTSLSDIVVVAPDLSRYEAALTDAAGAFDLQTAAWTQLPLTDTLPYRLVAAVCRVLVDAPCSRATLLAPLEYEWVHPEAADPAPVPTPALARLARELPEEERSLAEWNDLVAETEPPRSVTRYLGWVAATRDGPDPTPQTVRRTLSGIVDRYEEAVLPRRRDRDDEALGATARTTRSVVRMRDLVTQAAATYDDRLETGMEPSWRAVDRIAETVAGYRAGRREHANARALDLVEANDTWGLSRPVVIVVGLRDGEWLRAHESVLTDALAQRVLAGDGGGNAQPPGGVVRRRRP